MKNNFSDNTIISKYSKTVITAGESLYLNTGKKNKIDKITDELKELFKDSFNSPEKVFKFIESKGTKVIKTKYIDKVLSFIGEEEGFMLPIKGIKAFILTLMINLLSDTKVPVSLHSKEMFIFQDKPYSTYLLIHQVYHWISYLKGMPGYEDSSIHQFKEVLNNDVAIENMSVNQIIELKETIDRDIEAIKLVKDIVKDAVSAKNCFAKIKNGESLSL